MKQLLVILLLVLAWPASAWQDNFPKTVKEIRQRYAEAHQAIARMDETGVHNQVTLVVQRNMPATGLRTVTNICYFEEYQDEDMVGYMEYLPFFLTSRSNVSIREYYEEYLFDVMTGKPIFIFYQQNNEEEFDKKDETRYYFGPDGLISENIKGERIISPERAYDAAILLRDSMTSKMSY